MLSKEEKEAIEDIDLFIHDLNYGEMKMTIASERQKEIAQELQMLLNLLNKQQNEIEEKSTIIFAGAEKVKQLDNEIEDLKKNLEKLEVSFALSTNDRNSKAEMLKNSVSKDKIREVLKDLDEFDDYFFNVSTLKEATKNSLTRLLEEK